VKHTEATIVFSMCVYIYLYIVSVHKAYHEYCTVSPAMYDFLLVSAGLSFDIMAYFLATLFIFLIFLLLTSSLKYLFLVGHYAAASYTCARHN
jgi:hypothetical protein